ncbi:MAG: hypothetical protein Q4C66_05325 [Lachnospiraceae bacterium]|nr:hypothetical protein [Lachnospiraceae bacterium]
MKIRVSMPGAYMAMELEEEKAKQVFRKMTELLCLTGAVHPVKKVQEPEPVSAKIDVETGTEEIAEADPEEDTLEAPAPQPFAMPEKEFAPPKASAQYSGFLHIRCHSCGNAKGFFAKIRTREFRCGCGEVTDLHDLVPLYMHCECGRNIRYMTNVTEDAFDIICPCGAPVAVQWNEKKKQYETIQ